MDPKQCLVDVETAIDDRELGLASERLRDYWQWRGQGGYQPIIYGMRGDLFARCLAASLERLGG